MEHFKFREQEIKFQSLDGIELNGALTFPKDDASIRGGFLLLHGCPAYMDEYGFYRDINTNDGMSEFLAAHGYVSLRFNYRSQSKDIKPEEMGDLSISGMIVDTESAYHKLVEHLKNDLPIYVVGTSFAGGISIQWINSFERDIKHLFLMCPLLNMRHALKASNALVSNGVFELLSPDIIAGLQKEGQVYRNGIKMNYAFFDELLTMNVKREFSLLKCPSTVFHGTIDSSVPYEDSKEFVEKHSNRQSVLYTYENARHGFGQLDANGKSDPILKKRNHHDIFKKMLERIEV